MIDVFFNFMQKWPLWALLGGSAASVIMGDFLAKYWSLHPRLLWFALAWLAYAASSIFYIPSLMKEGLIITSLIWSLLAILGFLLVGLVFFHESLTGLQWLGLALGIVALIILSATVK